MENLPTLSYLDFSRIEILLFYFLPAFINLLIYIYTCLKLKGNRTNLFFSLFVLLLSIWQFAEGLVKISSSLEYARGWHTVSEIAILFIIPVGIMFLIYFTDLRKIASNNIFLLTLYFPVFLFLVFIQVGVIKYTLIESSTWYWIANPIPNFSTNLFFIWTSIGGLAMLFLLGRYFYKSKGDDSKRKQSGLLLIGISLPVFGGIIAEVIFPLVLDLDDVPITAPLVTSLSLLSVVAIKKYGLLDYSPKHQWERIVAQMNEGILIVNREDVIMYANKTFCKITGYELHEIKGRIAKDILLDQEDIPTINKVLEKQQNNQSYRFEMQIKPKSGANVWLDIRNAPYFDSNGKIIGSIGIQTDITERKKNENSTRHNEFRLNQAQSVAKIGSWELNFSTGKAIWSDEACRIYGLSVTEKNDQTYNSWLEFIHPKDLPAVKTETERSRAQLSNSSFKHRIIRRDGEIRYIHSVSHFEFNEAGYPVGLFGVCHDISDQAEAENALDESEQNMRTFMNESLLSIYFVDPETKKITFCNPALSDLLGYTMNELVQISPYLFINHSTEDINSRIKEVMEKKKINTGERQWKRKDGRVVNVLVSSFYHRQNGKDAIYVAAQDITERKIAEEKLEETNKELELFIYKTSHDIRGPLTSIMGLVNVSKYEIKDEKSIQYLDMIKASTQKLDYTLGELVKAMNIKDVAVFNEKVNFNELIDDILKKFTHFPGYKGLQISTKIEMKDEFFSNRLVLETILQNLLENSIKYQRNTPDGSFIHIHIKGSGDKVSIQIDDNGVGIDKEYQSRIFDMYFKANYGSKGSGLGLYLVKKGIDKLHGEIRMKSVSRQGTTFTVTIPSYSNKKFVLQ